MPELFTSKDREAAKGGVLELKGRIIAFTAALYFDPAWLAEDGTRKVRVHKSPNIGLYDFASKKEITKSEFDVDEFEVIAVFARKASTAPGDEYIALDFVSSDGQRTWGLKATFDAFQLDFLADFDRDGKLDTAQPNSDDWTWGEAGSGAIVLVNSDRDGAYPNPNFRDRLDRVVNGPLDLEDMTKVAISLVGPQGAHLSDCTIRVHVSDAAASRLRVFDISRVVPEAVIGPGVPTAVFPAPLGTRELALEGLDYPDAGFSGIISVSADVECNGVILGGTGIVLRVAPWLALPNTQPVTKVYIAEMEDGSNTAAIRDLRTVTGAAGVPLITVPPKINRNDRWLQDEIEIGYAATPAKAIPVVLDSPRNRELDQFPEEMLLGPDFGYVTRGNDRQASSLDSFGNLDCTPPYRGSSGDYPFGRILFGGAAPGGTQGRRMMKVVRDFVYAQQVQAPIELYSDWLLVGHIDEFMSFVPAPDETGFRLVLASPKLAMAMLRSRASKGQGAQKLMEGKPTESTIAEIVGDKTLVALNEQYQQHIDWNRNRLVEEMGLKPHSILELPALYKNERGRAGALFPNMVNLQVINSHLAIPKPFGPLEDGTCIFEKVATQMFGELRLSSHYVDTYEGYFLQLGEIHCGTNVVREPFKKGWWTFTSARESRSLGRLIV
ncbi:MAG: protein-arginine deiminase family protein [Reyranellaceae bacterium]